jgi:hypothetical protein
MCVIDENWPDLQGVPPTHEYRAIGMDQDNVPGIVIEVRPREARGCEGLRLELNEPSPTSTFQQN